MCVRKKKPKRGVCVCVWREEAGGGAGEPIVDMLMLLTISTAIKMSCGSTCKSSSAGAFHAAFPDTVDLVPRKSPFLKRHFEELVRTDGARK